MIVPAGLMPNLRVTSKGHEAAVFELEGEQFTIGREPDNTIRLTHTSVSKHHALLTVDNGDFKVWDLHSTNGVIVNDESTVVRSLKDGDRIVLGEIELCFESSDKTITQRRPLPPEISAPPVRKVIPQPDPAPAAAQPVRQSPLRSVAPTQVAAEKQAVVPSLMTTPVQSGPKPVVAEIHRPQTSEQQTGDREREVAPVRPLGLGGRLSGLFSRRPAPQVDQSADPSPPVVELKNPIQPPPRLVADAPQSNVETVPLPVPAKIQPQPVTPAETKFAPGPIATAPEMKVEVVARPPPVPRPEAKIVPKPTTDMPQAKAESVATAVSEKLQPRPPVGGVVADKPIGTTVDVKSSVAVRPLGKETSRTTRAQPVTQAEPAISSSLKKPFRLVPLFAGSAGIGVVLIYLSYVMELSPIALFLGLAFGNTGLLGLLIVLLTHYGADAEQT